MSLESKREQAKRDVFKSNLYYTSLELLLKDVYSKCAPEKLDTGIVAKAYVVRERSDFSLGLSLYHTYTHIIKHTTVWKRTEDTKISWLLVCT